MLKIVEYKVINGYSALSCEIAVNELLRKGWLLYGTPFNHGSSDVCQAMVRMEEESGNGGS